MNITFNLYPTYLGPLKCGNETQGFYILHKFLVKGTMTIEGQEFGLQFQNAFGCYDDEYRLPERELKVVPLSSSFLGCILADLSGDDIKNETEWAKFSLSEIKRLFPQTNAITSLESLFELYVRFNENYPDYMELCKDYNLSHDLEDYKEHEETGLLERVR